MDWGEKTSSEEAAVLISDCYQFCWNRNIIGCFLSHTEDKAAWTFKGSNLDWPCPVNGWLATTTNEAVCRRWVWNDWSIYYSSAKLHMYIWFICFFVCLHEVRGNWQTAHTSQSIQWWCILHKKNWMLFHDLAPCNLISWDWSIL